MLGANLISIGTIVTTCAYIHALALRADWEWRNTGRNLWQKVHRLVTTWNHGDVCRTLIADEASADMEKPCHG